MLFVSD